jgi:hypothetical protein
MIVDARSSYLIPDDAVTQRVYLGKLLSMSCHMAGDRLGSPYQESAPKYFRLSDTRVRGDEDHICHLLHWRYSIISRLILTPTRPTPTEHLHKLCG